MIFEHEVNERNEAEIGNKLGRHVVIMTRDTWRRLSHSIENARRHNLPGFDWNLNLALVDMGEAFEEEEEDEEEENDCNPQVA